MLRDSHSETCLDMKEAFDVLDEDKDGQISVEDLGKFMKMIGMVTSNAELAELVFEFDSDGNDKAKKSFKKSKNSFSHQELNSLQLSGCK